VADALPGRPSPLGATPRDGGINFAVASGVAEAAEVCLFGDSGEQTRWRLRDYDDGVWHGFVPGAAPGQAYGFRVQGPYDAARGLRCNPAKLLLDPYARAVRGEVSFGPEVFDYSWDDHDAPSPLDSAGHVPLSLVTDGAFDWGGDAPPRRDFADTVLYEIHVKGFTMRHPAVPAGLRGTYAGLAREAVLSYLTDLGVTAVELLPGLVRSWCCAGRGFRAGNDTRESATSWRYAGSARTARRGRGSGSPGRCGWTRSLRRYRRPGPGCSASTSRPVPARRGTGIRSARCCT